MQKKSLFIKVTDAKYVEDYKIQLRFTDNTEGIADLKDELWGEVFEPLLDIDNFKKFSRDRWTICWDCGADFAPEFLHELILKQKLNPISRPK